ncbi:MAG: hypothetical protein HY319_13820 [Armatimonadetes bacterium]|nr:hypothetical protein [Armatimonadota bacterium]
MCVAKNGDRSGRRSDPRGQEDRRDGARANRQFRVYYRSGDGSYVATWALNLSVRGARVIVHDRACTGESLELWLHVDRNCYRLAARRVWDVILPGGGCRVVGVAFGELEPGLARDLQERLASTSEPEPVFPKSA